MPLAELKVKVTPKSSKNQVVMGDPVRVYVRAAPTDGQANGAVVEVIARALGVPKSKVAITRGQTSRVKLVQIQDMTAEQLTAALESLS